MNVPASCSNVMNRNASELDEAIKEAIPQASPACLCRTRRTIKTQTAFKVLARDSVGGGPFYPRYQRWEIDPEPEALPDLCSPPLCALTFSHGKVLRPSELNTAAAPLNRV